MKRTDTSGKNVIIPFTGKCLLASLGLVIMQATALAQDCTNKWGGNNEHYFVNPDGTVTDIDSGLTWMRCAAGQQWNGATCTGAASLLTWDEASRQFTGNNSPWRLPRLTELASIVDMHCKAPRIDLGLFPATAPQAYWTVSKAPGNTNQVYTLSFGAEGVSQAHRTEKHFVRLVRGRD